jgi:hypothetical protein
MTVGGIELVNIALPYKSFSASKTRRYARSMQQEGVRLSEISASNKAIRCVQSDIWAVDPRLVGCTTSAQSVARFVRQHVPTSLMRLDESNSYFCRTHLVHEALRRQPQSCRSSISAPAVIGLVREALRHYLPSASKLP